MSDFTVITNVIYTKGKFTILFKGVADLEFLLVDLVFVGDTDLIFLMPLNIISEQTQGT